MDAKKLMPFCNPKIAEVISFAKFRYNEGSVFILLHTMTLYNRSFAYYIDLVVPVKGISTLLSLHITKIFGL